MSSHTIQLPPRREIRGAIGDALSRWARARGHAPHAVHQTLHRYAGTEIDMTRVWGEHTRAILLDIHADIVFAGLAASLQQDGSEAESAAVTAPSASPAPPTEDAA